MDRLALIGVSHRRGGAASLEAWQTWFGAGSDERLEQLGLPEFVPLVTCNRFDVVIALPEGVSAEDARCRLTPSGSAQRPYAYSGEAALEQLTRIACSLDSLNPGEDQIMSQVREAYRAAQRAGHTGPTTSFAFDSALRTAKRVRREVPLAPVNTSLFSLARPILERRLPDGGNVAVLGAGEMGALAAKSLADMPNFGLLVVNRTETRARQLARHLRGRHQSLDQFLTEPHPVEALVAATPVHHLVDARLLERLPGLRLIVDLGVPRNANRAEAQARGIEVVDVDSLQDAGSRRRAELSERLAEAEMILRSELDAAVAEWAERQLGPSIKRLRELYLQTIGDTLPEEDARRLAHRFSHVPVKGLRAVAREHGMEAARTFLDETGLLE